MTLKKFLFDATAQFVGGVLAALAMMAVKVILGL